MPSLRFKMSDLSPRQQEQVRRQLASPEHSSANAAREPAYAKHEKVRAPIRMPRKRTQSAAEKVFNRDFLMGHGKYEAIVLNLPGGVKYTPDFFHADPSHPNDLYLWEVKGDYRLHSQARAATAFKTACAAFPEFVFGWAEKQKSSDRWKLTLFQNGEQISDTKMLSAQEARKLNGLGELSDGL